MCRYLCSELVFLISARVSLQVELTGSSVFDYIHPADHVEMAERLGIRPHLRAEAGCHVAPESASSSASASSLAGTPEPGTHHTVKIYREKTEGQIILFTFHSLFSVCINKKKNNTNKIEITEFQIWPDAYVSLTWSLILRSSVESSLSCRGTRRPRLLHPHEVHAHQERPACQVFRIQGTESSSCGNTPCVVQIAAFSLLFSSW